MLIQFLKDWHQWSHVELEIHCVCEFRHILIQVHHINFLFWGCELLLHFRHHFLSSSSRLCDWVTTAFGNDLLWESFCNTLSYFVEYLMHHPHKCIGDNDLSLLQLIVAFVGSAHLRTHALPHEEFHDTEWVEILIGVWLVENCVEFVHLTIYGIWGYYASWVNQAVLLTISCPNGFYYWFLGQVIHYLQLRHHKIDLPLYWRGFNICHGSMSGHVSQLRVAVKQVFGRLLQVLDERW